MYLFLSPFDNSLQTVVSPHSDIRQLRFVFAVPPQEYAWDSKPLSFLRQLLDLQGTRSLASQLRRRGLVTAVSSSEMGPEYCSLLEVWRATPTAATAAAAAAAAAVQREAVGAEDKAAAPAAKAAAEGAGERHQQGWIRRDWNSSKHQRGLIPDAGCCCLCAALRSASC